MVISPTVLQGDRIVEVIDDYTIRPAGPGDVAGLAAVERQAARLFEGWTGETGLTPEMLEKVSSVEELDGARQRGHLWVATSGEEIVGFAQALILDDAAHLDEIDVVPEHTRKGIGSRLIETVCEWRARPAIRESRCRRFATFPGTGRSISAAASAWSIHAACRRSTAIWSPPSSRAACAPTCAS